MKPYVKRFQIMLPEPMMEQLRKTAEGKGIAISEIIRHAIEMYYEALVKKSS